jgi:hypothetical protein
MITKTLFIAKDLRTYSIRILRQEKVFAIMGPSGGRPVTQAVGAADVVGDPQHPDARATGWLRRISTELPLPASIGMPSTRHRFAAEPPAAPDAAPVSALLDPSWPTES